MSTGFRSLAFWLIGLGSMVAAAAPEQATFRVGVDVVTVDVSVNRGGHPVSGLTLDNFIVFDKGVRQKLDSMAAERVPLDAFLVLDVSGSLAGERLVQLTGAAEAFLDGVSEHDRVALVTFSHRILVRSPLTLERDRVRHLLAAAEGTGGTALYDATYAALRLPETGQHRVVAVLFSDGHDNASWLSPDRVVGSAARSDVIVYGVTLGEDVPPPTISPGIVRAQTQPSRAFLRAVSSATGGRLFHAATAHKLRETFSRVLDDVGARYLLRYSPDRMTPGWHEIEVRLQNARGDVMARRGYFASR